MPGFPRPTISHGWGFGLGFNLGLSAFDFEVGESEGTDDTEGGGRLFCIALLVVKAPNETFCRLQRLNGIRVLYDERGGKQCNRRPAAETAAGGEIAAKMFMAH